MISTGMQPGIRILVFLTLVTLCRGVWYVFLDSKPCVIPTIRGYQSSLHAQESLFLLLTAILHRRKGYKAMLQPHP